MVPTIKPSSTNNKTVKWTSSDETIATVDGTNLSASCYITSNVDYLKDNINKDEIVDVADVTYGMYTFSRRILTEDEKNRGIVKRDDIFDVADVLKIMRYLYEKISSLD